MDSAEANRSVAKPPASVQPTTVYLIAFLVSLTASYYLYRITSDTFQEGHNIPCGYVAGIDFRQVHEWENNLTQGKRAFLKGGFSYPPLMMLIYWPFSSLSASNAYVLYTVILQATLFFSLSYLVRQGRFSWENLRPGWLVAGAAALWAIFNQTYPVVFSLERGNSDIIALGFCCAFFWALQRERFYSATCFLFLATQMKIYPGILVFLLLNRAGWKFVPLFFGLNAAGLFVLGRAAFVSFLQCLRLLVASPYAWAGNHSLASFLHNVFVPWESGHDWLLQGLKLGFPLAFGCLWLHDAIRQGALGHFSRPATGEVRSFSPIEVALIGLACQIMCLLPGTSHDYKLVIQIMPVVLLWTGASHAIGRLGTPGLVVMGGLGTINGWIFGPIQWKSPVLMLAFVGYFWLGILAIRAESPFSNIKREGRHGSAL